MNFNAFVLVGILSFGFQSHANPVRCSDEKNFITVFEHNGFNPDASGEPSIVSVYGIRPMETVLLATLPCFYGTRNNGPADMPREYFYCSSPNALRYAVKLYDRDQFGQRMASISYKNAHGTRSLINLPCRAR